MQNLVLTILLTIYQGAADPTNRADVSNQPYADDDPWIMSATASMCPVDFCEGFEPLCVDSGAEPMVCQDNAIACEEAPCAACDDAVANCNEAGGKHCDLLADACREDLAGCCRMTVHVACPSTESLEGFAPQFCIDHPWGRPATCGDGGPSSEACGKMLSVVDGCDITLCEYKACAAALLTAECDDVPVECEAIFSC